MNWGSVNVAQVTDGSARNICRRRFSAKDLLRASTPRDQSGASAKRRASFPIASATGSARLSPMSARIRRASSDQTGERNPITLFRIALVSGSEHKSAIRRRSAGSNAEPLIPGGFALGTVSAFTILRPTNSDALSAIYRYRRYSSSPPAGPSSTNARWPTACGRCPSARRRSARWRKCAALVSRQRPGRAVRTKHLVKQRRSSGISSPALGRRPASTAASPRRKGTMAVR